MDAGWKQWLHIYVTIIGDILFVRLEIAGELMIIIFQYGEVRTNGNLNNNNIDRPFKSYRLNSMLNNYYMQYTWLQLVNHKFYMVNYMFNYYSLLLNVHLQLCEWRIASVLIVV